MGTYTIGQVSERSGFSRSALRFYEKHGLLDPAARTDAGYRLYDDHSLARLEFVARAKQLGCSLDEIVELAGLWEGDECEPVQVRLHDLVTAKLADARRQRRELGRFTGQLVAAASRLGTDPVDGPCADECACNQDAEDTTSAERVPIELGRRLGDDEPIACTLEPDAISGRIDAWDDVLAHVTDRSATDDGGLRLSLGPDAPLDELTRLVVAEQGCCSFFAFTITADARGFALEVRAPAEAADVVATLFGEPA